MTDKPLTWLELKPTPGEWVDLVASAHELGEQLGRAGLPASAFLPFSENLNRMHAEVAAMVWSRRLAQRRRAMDAASLVWLLASLLPKPRSKRAHKRNQARKRRRGWR